MEKFFHPYHMVNMSPWPLMAGFAILTSVIGLIKMFIFMEVDLLKLSFIFLFMVVLAWWRDVVRESTFQGYHSSLVVSGLMLGMILFIVSEIFFFLSFFWAFFHSSLNPVIELGGVWPPMGVDPLNAFQVPLLNTIILLGSGVSVTWAHQALLMENLSKAKISLMLTWLLGLYFLFLQWVEYSMSSFSISDSIFGSSFFMATGFHGFHVIVGTFFLFVMWMRVKKNHFSSSHHFGFECAAWYWHFVDVVWLFLFSVVYWWGS
uniref:Cytochrome c oxidase subunit 3 n=1 Tax=Linyphia triangularis TaxID=94031 RepID=A0A7L7S1D6_LINTI|nr:cytochrome c oxidase subunit III [Linyphia triangularis]